MDNSKLIGHDFRFKVKERDGWLIPELFIDGEEVGFTQGRTDSEALDMMADWYKCLLGIKCPWYDRWFAAIKRVLDLP